MKRAPAVAGRFYSSDSEALREEVTAYLADAGPAHARVGCVMPHAGYMFSGATAGKVLGSIDVPETVIILSPNHTGMGDDFSVWDGEAWQTPLGDVPVDMDLSRDLAGLPGASQDTEAHVSEHSIEVILPFLKVRQPQAAMAAITIRCSDFDALTAFGKGLAELIRSREGEVLIIASSDMTHMESADSAREKDMQCVEQMKAVDPAGFYKLVKSKHITVCGVYPITVLLTVCRELEVETGSLVEYTNSGESSGDFSRVVGYAGVVF